MPGVDSNLIEIISRHIVQKSKLTYCAISLHFQVFKRLVFQFDPFPKEMDFTLDLTRPKLLSGWSFLEKLITSFQVWIYSPWFVTLTNWVTLFAQEKDSNLRHTKCRKQHQAKQHVILKSSRTLWRYFETHIRSLAFCFSRAPIQT